MIDTHKYSRTYPRITQMHRDEPEPEKRKIKPIVVALLAFAAIIISLVV